jgi:predicted peroxiredoxin
MQELQNQINEPKEQLNEMRTGMPVDKLSMVVFSGSLDKLLAAFVIATGAVAMKSEVTMFGEPRRCALQRKKQSQRI